MRHALALLAAISASTAAPAWAGEPLDVDLARLGPPAASVYLAAAGCLTPTSDACTAPQRADAEAMAGDARVRFGRLVTDLALAFSGPLLQPASTTGYSGFSLGLEAAYVAVSPTDVGGTVPAGGSGTPTPAAPYWATTGEQPSGLLVPSLHVRKGLPLSFELGGRFSYLSQSSSFAAQFEGKWAFVEGYRSYPDAALRVAWTKVLGPPELDLRTTELDLLVSKRFGVGAVMSLTPYLAGRLTRLDASSRALAFLPDTPTPASPAVLALGSAAFPDVTSTLYRTTLGVRLRTAALSMGLEATWFGGAGEGKSQPAAGETPRYSIPSSFSGALQLGLEL